MGIETRYVTYALSCMEKSVAEFFQVTELEQIQAVCLLLYFPKNVKLLSASEGTALAWATRSHLVASCF